MVIDKGESAACARKFWPLVLGLSAVWLFGAAAPAHAAVNNFVLGMVTSGTAPFDASGGPGLDTAAGDTVVRTNDQFVYRVGYSLASSDTNRLLTVTMGATTLPGGYSGPALTPQQMARFAVADLPTGANGCANISGAPVAWPPAAGNTTSGVSADGQHIVCYQPGDASGANMNFIARVGGAAPNGMTIAAPAVSFQSTNNPAVNSPTVLNGSFGSDTFYGAPTLTVSAAPRWQIRKTAPPSAQYLPGSGPAGQDGYVVPFYIAIYATGSRKGLEALQPSYTIDEVFNDPDMPNAQLMNWPVANSFATLPLGAGAEPTAQNGCGDWRGQMLRLSNVFDALTISAGDLGATASTDSRYVARGGTCMASNVNNSAKTATLNVAGTDFSLTHYPVTNGTGGTVLVNVNDLDAATNEWRVAGKSVYIWVPVGDLTPNVAESLTNTTTLNASSVTGQPNLALPSSAIAGVTLQTGGTLSKAYSSMSNGAWIMPAGANAPQCDPNVTGDCQINQAAPGQLLYSRVIASSRTAGFTNGYLCDKIDNARFTLLDARTFARFNANYTVDPFTGMGVRYLSGNAVDTPAVWELGVGGNNVSNGTWPTRSNVPTEYGAGTPNGGVGDQGLAACGDADATWYLSIAALQAAGRSLSEVSRVRAKFANFAPATSFIGLIPLRVNATYAYPATETNSTTPSIAAGSSTLNSLAPNQAMWLTTSAAAPLKASDALRIFNTEYAQITKSAASPYNLDGAQVSRGAYVTYNLQVNLTTTGSAHTAASVVVWDVLPQYVDYVAGSSRFGGAALADPVCAAPGVTPAAPAPFNADSVPAGFKACSWTLSSQPVALTPRGNVAGNLPLITFQGAVDLNAQPGTSLLNTSAVDSSDNLMTDARYTGRSGFTCAANTTCSVGNWTLNVSLASGIAINKSVSADVVTPNTGLAYDLNYAAVGTTLTNLRLLDVLPYSGDSRGSTYAGSFQLASAIAPPAASAGPPALAADPNLVVRYTANAPANINTDPYQAGHNLAGTGTNSASATNWCTEAQFGSANCPASLAAVTGFMAFPRANADGVVPAGASYRLHVDMLPAGNVPANVYGNNFVADSPTLTARRPGSNTVTTAVTGVGIPGQTVSGRVYLESSTPTNTSDDGNAIDRGLSGVSMRLVCTSPAYDQTLTTGADGSFSFTGVTSGAVCTLTETQTAGLTNAYNTLGTGASAQTGDTGTGDSSITLTVPYNGSTGNRFAETAPAGADMVSTTVCTPNPAPGNTAVSCTVTCTNQGTGTAAGAVCSVPNAATLPGAPTPVCSAPNSVAPGATLTCTVGFTTPASGAVSVAGGTGAINDVNGGQDVAAGNNRSTASVGAEALAAVPTLGWPALLLLAGLLGLGGARRRRMA